MTRAELRRQAREAATPKKTYTLNEDQILGIKNEAVEKASEKAFFLMLAIPVMVLHDKYWEKTAKKRCPEFVEQCLDLYDSVEKGLVSLEDLKQCLYEESGIKIER